ncbi:hypothetical protein FQN49_000593 [Arthroderma sp. PD_2]|nr:hypothetical protein FQN49_000593 [Arthroderma sp. PD_2]
MKRVGLQAQRRAQGSICQLCAFSTSPISRRFTPFSPRDLINRSKPCATPYSSRTALRRNELTYRYALTAASVRYAHSNPSLRDVIRMSKTIMTGKKIPSEEKIVEIIKLSQQIAEAAQSYKEAEAPFVTKPKRKSEISSFLQLDTEAEEAEEEVPEPRGPPPREDPCLITRALSDVLNELLRDPKVFISPEILRRYTSIQCQFKTVEHIPAIFDLYANKPSPRSNGGEITYRPSNPKSAQNAIPSTIANEALEVAMEQRNLSLALAIIDKAFCTTAFYRSKIIKKATIPFAGVLATPPAAWVIASYLSTLQDSMDASLAKGIAFAGIMTYLTCTGTVGLVAAVTANDHMRRVVWIPGTPLRSRWLREEERLALDKIAQTWGFKDPLMRGEETGEEWDNLREFIGMRGMILDKTSHMEGME